MRDLDEALVVIPVPLESGAVTYTVARLIERDGEPVAQAMAHRSGSTFAPPRQVALSRYSLSRLRAGGGGRPELYFYEGMILPSPNQNASEPKA